MLKRCVLLNCKMLRKILPLLIFVFLALFSVCAYADSPRALLSGLSNGVIDLGKVSEGQVKKGTFLISNTGDAPLIIKSLQPSCSCVDILEPQGKLTILPQKEAVVVFSFNSTGYSGPTKEYIHLETNDPSLKTLQVEIRSEVVRSAAVLKERFLNFNLIFIISVGLIDGINPCAFTVIVFFMSFLFFVGYSRREIFIVGSAFIAAVFLTYSLIGLGIFSSLRHLPIFIIFSRLMYYLTGALALVLGILSLIDFWQYQKTKNTDKILLKLPDFLKKRITKAINQSLDKRRRNFKDILSLLSASFSCGIIVSFLESACTGQMYLPTIVFMVKNSSLKLSALLYLLVYNIMFVLPLIAVFLLAGFGVASGTFSRFTHKNLGVVKLVTALLFLLLAALLLIVVK